MNETVTISRQGVDGVRYVIEDDNGDWKAEGSVSRIEPGDNYYIHSFGVQAHCRRQGLATQMMNHIIATHGDKELHLWVGAVSSWGEDPMTNDQLLEFYSRWGFRNVDPTRPRSMVRPANK